MKFLFLVIGVFLLSVCSAQRRMALVVSKPYGNKLIEEIRLAAFGMYRLMVDSVGTFKPPSHDADKTIKFISERKDGYLGTIGLTEKGMFEGVDFFFPVPVYGFTIDNDCIVSDYILRFPDCNCTTKIDSYLIHIVLHEVGHVLGLSHCKTKHCIMRCCGELDNAHLCPRCKKLISEMKWY